MSKASEIIEDVETDFESLFNFLDSDLIEVKLYGNDGFDRQEVLEGNQYLIKLIKQLENKCNKLKQLTDWTAFEEKEPDGIDEDGYHKRYLVKKGEDIAVCTYESGQWLILFAKQIISPDNTFYKELE